MLAPPNNASLPNADRSWATRFETSSSTPPQLDMMLTRYGKLVDYSIEFFLSEVMSFGLGCDYCETDIPSYSGEVIRFSLDVTKSVRGQTNVLCVVQLLSWACLNIINIILTNTESCSLVSLCSIAITTNPTTLVAN